MSIHVLKFVRCFFFFFFFFNDTATTEIYTLSLHDALPICKQFSRRREVRAMTYFWSKNRKLGMLGSDGHHSSGMSALWRGEATGDLREHVCQYISFHFGIVMCLQIKSTLCISPKKRSQSQRSIRSDSTFSMHDLIDTTGGNSDRLCQRILTNSQRLQPLFIKNFSRRSK